jgi:hypothetical protein
MFCRGYYFSFSIAVAYVLIADLVTIVSVYTF